MRSRGRRTRRRLTVGVGLMLAAGTVGTFIPAVALLGRAAADTSQNTLNCIDSTLGPGTPLAFTSVTEGALSSSGSSPVAPGQANVSPGGTLNLVGSKNDIPDSALGSGVTLLNGPDNTGLGTVSELPSSFASLLNDVKGDTVDETASVPLTLSGATSGSSETLALSGSFTIPSGGLPSGTLGTLMIGSASGTITAGSSGTVTVSVPEFTSSSPLVITTTIPALSLTSTLTCTDSSAETIDTATISSSGTSAPSTTTTTTTTTVPPATTTTTAPTTTTTAAPSTQAAAITPTSSSSGGPSTGSSSGGSSTTASTLAFTGAGPDVWLLAFAGLILLDIGYLILTLYYRPRQLLALLLRRRGGRPTDGG